MGGWSHGAFPNPHAPVNHMNETHGGQPPSQQERPQLQMRSFIYASALFYLSVNHLCDCWLHTCTYYTGAQRRALRLNWELYRCVSSDPANETISGMMSISVFCHTHVVITCLKHCQTSRASSYKCFGMFPELRETPVYASGVKEVLMETLRGSSTWISPHYLKRGHGLVQNEAY